MHDRLRTLGWPVSGSVIIAGGGSIATLAAFEQQLPVVMTGVLLLLVGFRVSQLGLYADDPLYDLAAARHAIASPAAVIRLLLVFAGWIGISIGITVFAQTIRDPSLLTAVLSGIASVAGYMCAHVGINAVGLGYSFFAPVFSCVKGPREE